MYFLYYKVVTDIIVFSDKKARAIALNYLQIIN